MDVGGVCTWLAGRAACRYTGQQSQDLQLCGCDRASRRPLLCRRVVRHPAFATSVAAAAIAPSFTAAAVATTSIAAAISTASVTSAAIAATVTSTAIAAAAVSTTIAAALSTATISAAAIAPTVAPAVAATDSLPAGFLLPLLATWMDLRSDIWRLRQQERGYGRLPQQRDMDRGRSPLPSVRRPPVHSR